MKFVLPKNAGEKGQAALRALFRVYQDTGHYPQATVEGMSLYCDTPDEAVLSYENFIDKFDDVWENS